MSYVREVQTTHEFSGGDPVWTSALSITLPIGTTECTVPALGGVEYAVRSRELDVFGNVSAWSPTVLHTTAAGSDGLLVTTAETATTALDVADGVVTLAKLASDASTALADAQADATSALSALTDIASDSLLSPVEKPPVIADYAVITGEQSGIDAQATAYGITTTKTAYDTAVSALTTYLATLTAAVAWNDTSGNTTIVGTTFRSKFEDVYTTRQAVLNAIYAAAKTLADAAQATAISAGVAASAAQATADGKNTAFYQTSAPSTSGRITGDLWFDTDDGYKLYVFSSGAWTASAFGNAAIGSLDAGKITTGVLDANLINIKDVRGTTVLNGAGFSGSWADFIALGLYNARFLSGTAGVIANGSTTLPYWTVSDPDVTAETLTLLAAGGVKMTWGGINLRKQIASIVVPVIPGKAYELGAAFTCVRAAGNVYINAAVTWLKSDLTAASVGGENALACSSLNALTSTGSYIAAAAVAPPDAAYAQVTVYGEETVSHSATNSLTITAVWLKVAPAAFVNAVGDSVYGGLTTPYLNAGAAALIASTGMSPAVQMADASATGLAVSGLISAASTRPGMVAFSFTGSLVSGGATLNLNNAGGLTVPRLVMPWAGRIVGVAVRVNTTRTAGTASARATINGTAKALLAVINGTDTAGASGVAAYASAETFSAGQSLGAAVTTSSFTPISPNLVQVDIYVVFDAVA